MSSEKDDFLEPFSFLSTRTTTTTTTTTITAAISAQTLDTIETADKTDKTDKTDTIDTIDTIDKQSYYQKSIMTILTSVQNIYGNIFNEKETILLRKMMELSSDAQKLLFRLYLRKSGWIKCSKLDYKDIINVTSAIEILDQLEFIDRTLTDAIEAINVLQMEELKLMAKELNVKSAGKMREQLISNLLDIQNSKQTRLCFLSKSCSKSSSFRGSIADEGLEKILSISVKLAGPVLRISPAIRLMMDRLIGLYFLKVAPSWEEAGSNDLSTAILTDLNRIKYPPYVITRSRPVFADRTQWEEYEEAIAYENTSMEILQNEEISLQAILDLLFTVQERFQTNVSLSNDKKEKDKSSSYFLQRYTSGWVYARLMAFFVGLLEKVKEFEQANKLLKLLLGQDHYCLDQRGKWWERLVINTERHLGEKAFVIDIIKQALDDPNVKTGSRFAFERRLYKVEKQDNPTQCNNVEAPPIELTITIYADPEDKRKTGRKLLYLLPDGFTLGSVEQLAQDYFQTLGWISFHSEGSIYRTLFTLIFWDIIFSNVPDVFQTPHQSAPLDLFTDAFYLTRKKEIEDRLDMIDGDLDGSIIAQLLVDSYYPFFECQAVGVQWEEYSLAVLLDICHTLTGKVLAPILRILAEDYANSCSGLPDLLLYKPDRSDYLLVEVKSSNDRFSDGQKNWNAIFKKNGIKFALCKVLDTSEQDKLVITSSSGSGTVKRRKKI